MGGGCQTKQQLHPLDDSVVLEVLDDAGRPVAPGAGGGRKHEARKGFTEQLRIAGDLSKHFLLGCFLAAKRRGHFT